MIEAGTPAPEFELKADDGSTVTLAGLRGRRVVLYFYPKDDTPGCTAQACGIRDQWQDFRGVDAVVLGVSPDDEASHRRFKEKYGLPFTLLADEDHAVAERYGVWGERHHVRQDLHGDQALDVRDRRERDRALGDVRREAGHARGARARSARRLGAPQ